MKVAIITFHAAYNYGAVLQTYALKTYLSECGFDVSVLDYRPLALRNPYALVPCFDFRLMGKNRFKRGWKWSKIALHWLLKEIPFRARRRRLFEAFIAANFNPSKICYDIAFTSNYDYDVYVFGSDQIWNPHITRGFDNVFWGDFEVAKGARKIAYAASMVNHELSVAQNAYVKECVERNFSHISVREKRFSEFLWETFKKKVPVVLDPTLLVEQKVWERIARKPKFNQKYVLVYALEFREDAIQMATKIARQIDADVVEIVTGKKPCLKTIQTMPSPEEFVGLFKNAQFVIAESFHGTIFSIVFHQPFVSISRGTNHDSRQTTLLEAIGLVHCLLPSTSRPDYFELDYDSIQPQIGRIREFSIAYLEQSLSV